MVFLSSPVQVFQFERFFSAWLYMEKYMHYTCIIHVLYMYYTCIIHVLYMIVGDQNTIGFGLQHGNPL